MIVFICENEVITRVENSKFIPRIGEDVIIDFVSYNVEFVEYEYHLSDLRNVTIYLNEN